MPNAKQKLKNMECIFLIKSPIFN